MDSFTPHPGAYDVIQALESIGVKCGADAFFVPCRRCKRMRRFEAVGISSMRVLGLLFCLDCIRTLKLATTQQNQIIVS